MGPRTDRRQRLFELAAVQAGHFTAAQAHALGYSTRSLAHHAQAGHFQRLGRGFYRLAEFPALPYEDIIAAWLQLGPDRAVVSHDTALALYELAPSRSRGIHLTVPREHRPRRSRGARTSVRIHTTTHPLHRSDVIQRFGARVTSPARTIADTADLGADPSVVIEAVVRALTTGLVSVTELRHAIRDRSERVRCLVNRAIEAAAPRAPVR